MEILLSVAAGGGAIKNNVNVTGIKRLTKAVS
jgi:hypothetical protein